MRRAALPLPCPVRGPRPVFTALLALLVLDGGADASGGIEVRRGGSSWARIGEDGSVRVEGRVVGDIGKDGTVRVEGKIEGRVDEDGTIRENGRIAGRVGEDGTLRSEGSLLGRIDRDGSIRRRGSLWGSASPCCSGFDASRRVAALLFFFDRGYFGP